MVDRLNRKPAGTKASAYDPPYYTTIQTEKRRTVKKAFIRLLIIPATKPGNGTDRYDLDDTPGRCECQGLVGDIHNYEKFGVVLNEIACCVRNYELASTKLRGIPFPESAP